MASKPITSDVIKIAKYHINNYLKNDIQTKGKEIVASRDFINLYDINDNLFAYIVPLIEKGNGEIGYITVGAIEDGYNVYEIFIDSNIVSKIKASLNEQSRFKESKLVFIPPVSYIIKANEGKNIKYFDISKKNEPSYMDITNTIDNNVDKIRKRYNKIRNNRNKVQLQNILKNSNTENLNIQTSQINYESSVDEEDVRLVNEAKGKFVPVTYGSTTYYGGSQMWWPDGSTKETRGCGPTAAANITCYLAKKDSSKYGKLYSPSSMSRADFLKHMDTLYSYINPGILGETSLENFTSNIEKYASDKGVSLKRVISSASFTLDNTATYIKNGLNSDCPVAILNLTLPGGDYEYAWHWMTITKYFRDVNDNRWIAVSSWGKRYSINYRTAFDAMDGDGDLGGGLMYFK